MTTMSTTGLYEFDPYGTNPANLIDPERQTLQTPGEDDFFFIIPQASPFFVDSFQVWNDTTNAPYEEGVDFVFGHYFPEAMDSIGRPIAGSIRFLKRDISGIVRMRYRTLGGQWGFSDQAILTELSNKLYNPIIRSWGQIDVLPASFPVVPHDQSLDTLTGSDTINAALENLADLIAGTQGAITDNHLLDYNNPHQVTKSQIGLSNVQNFPVASDLQMQAGQATNVYATAYGVYLAIAQFAVIPLDTHKVDYNNPHQVTKDQVGLSQVANYPPASAEEAINPTINNRYLTPYTAALLLNAQSDVGRIQALEDDFNAHLIANNPHGITPAMIGTLTEAEIIALVGGGEATDTTRFAGMTEAEWRASLPSFSDFTTTLDSLKSYFETASGNAQALVATDPTTTEQQNTATLALYDTVVAGYDGWGVMRANLETLLRQSTGNAGLPDSLEDGQGRMVILENAQYYVDDMGDVFNFGSASIDTPVLATAAVAMWATKTAVYNLRPDDSLARYTSAGSVTVLYASGVDTMFANTEDAASGEFVIIRMLDGSYAAYGQASFVTAANTLLAGWVGNPLREDISDIVIGNAYIAFQFTNNDVLVYEIDRTSGIALTPVTLPVGYPSQYTQIAGAYDHLAMLDADGKIWFYGENLYGQQEVDPVHEPYLSVACGKRFTVTLDSKRRLMFWGETPDNALLPKDFN